MPRNSGHLVDVMLLTKNSLKPCLEEALESLFRNVPVNTLIVIDGGSSDGTIEYLSKYQNAQTISARAYYRQDCLFKPPPVFPIGNLEKWKVPAWRSCGSPNGFLDEG